MLPEPPAPPGSQEAEALRVLDVAGEMALQDEVPADELHAARLRLGERRLREAFTTLEAAEWRHDTLQQLAKLKTHYQQALTAYETVCLQQIE
jgi:hypothetical protein